MSTPPHTLGWAAYGLWRHLSERDQDQPLRLDDLRTPYERSTAGIRTLVERLERAGLLTRERTPTGFAQGAAWLYRTHHPNQDTSR